MRAAQTFQNKPADHARGITKLGIPQSPHYPIGVKRVHVNSPNVEDTVFQTFWNYKQRSCIQFITNEQVELTSFKWEGVDFTLGIHYVPLSLGSIWKSELWTSTEYLVSRYTWKPGPDSQNLYAIQLQIMETFSALEPVTISGAVLRLSVSYRL